jgi:transcriptional regulator with XRE-family HTH domain
MTGYDLRLAFMRLGWTQARGAKELGRTERQVRRWLEGGHRPVPDWVDVLMGNHQPQQAPVAEEEH